MKSLPDTNPKANQRGFSPDYKTLYVKRIIYLINTDHQIRLYNPSMKRPCLQVALDSIDSDARLHNHNMRQHVTLEIKKNSKFLTHSRGLHIHVHIFQFETTA